MTEDSTQRRCTLRLTDHWLEADSEAAHHRVRGKVLRGQHPAVQPGHFHERVELGS